MKRKEKIFIIGVTTIFVITLGIIVFKQKGNIDDSTKQVRCYSFK